MIDWLSSVTTNLNNCNEFADFYDLFMYFLIFYFITMMQNIQYFLSINVFTSMIEINIEKHCLHKYGKSMQ